MSGRELPILFSGPMVEAILDGRKTMTRRALNPQPYFLTGNGKRIYHDRDLKRSWEGDPTADLKFHKGDLLWVREAFTEVGNVDPQWVLYRASGFEQECIRHGFSRPYPPESSIRWRPSIHMPKRHARIWLRVTDVRVEKVQDISEADARAEGVEPINEPDESKWQHYTPHGIAFQRLWDSLNAKRGYGWDVNPWVAAIAFERCEAPS